MPKFPISMTSEPRRGALAVPRLLAALGSTVVVIGALFGIMYSAYLNYTEISAPELNVPEGRLEVGKATRKVRYARSSINRSGRIWSLHLEGSPAEIGSAQARLTAQLQDKLDNRIDAFLARRYTTPIDAWSESMRLRWDYYQSDNPLAPAQRTELAALGAMLPERNDNDLSRYHRSMLQQCFLDLTQRLVEDMIIEGNMFAFESKPNSATSQASGLIIGRTFGVDLGDNLETDRIVTVYRPDGRYPFVSVGWAGLSGVVTGINARGIAVTINAARIDDPSEDGIAWPLVLRNILEEADTLEQAITIIQNTPVRTAGIVLIADGVQRKSAVAEVSPRTTEARRVIRGEDDDIVWATNHMISDRFERDAHNHRIRISTTSGYRYDRLGELLNQGPLTREHALDILRDRHGKEGTKIGLGNRSALENLLATHVVLIDATAMTMWVGEGPSGIGRLRAFDLRQLLGRNEQQSAPLQDFPADPLLYSEEYLDYVEAQQQIDYAQKLFGRGYTEQSLDAAMIAQSLAPSLGNTHRLLGDVHRELGNDDLAVEHYKAYVELVPGRVRDQQRVVSLIDELEHR